MKRIDPLRAGGGRKLLRLWKCLSSFSLPEVCRSSSGGSGVRGEREVLEGEDFLFLRRLDANAAECFVIRSLITTNIIT